MPLSPQSAQVVDSLLRGQTVQSGNVVLGPLDQATSILLEILITDFDALHSFSGVEQAKDLLARYEARQAVEVAPDVGSAANAEDRDRGAPIEGRNADDGEAIPRRGWRLIELQASSFRGLAPPGVTITFPFEGKSNLIYGPSGSGKSSLLGAVIWVLTNQTVTDADEDAELADVYEVSEDTGPGRRIRRWPTHVTLPDTGIVALDPASLVTLKLQSGEGATCTWLRRTDSKGLEHSTDCEEWQPLDDLAKLGIEPLDLQLSLIAPLIFGRHTVERAEESKEILRLMLGYDDLARIGKLASNLASNRTRLENNERIARDTALAELQNKLRELPGEIAEEMPIRIDLEALAADESPTEDAIKEVEETINLEIKNNEKSIAAALGLEASDAERPKGLADKLTVAVANLEADVAENFPSVTEIRIASALPEAEGVKPERRLPQLADAVENFVLDARIQIAKRYEWWQEETAPGSRAGLLLEAAQYYDPQAEECPVCDRDISELDVKNELLRLKDFDPVLRKEAQDFFRDLCDEFDTIVPHNIQTLRAVSPKERIEQDWSMLKQQRLDRAFASLVTAFDPTMQGIADQCVFDEPTPADLLPDEAEEVFVGFATALVSKVNNTLASIAVLRWSASEINRVEESIAAAVSHIGEGNGKSLLAILSKGKGAADTVGTLNRVRKALREAYEKRQAVTKKETTLGLLADWREPLNTLKQLGAFAESAIDAIFGDIIEDTDANWKKLYPETPSGLKPAPLVMQPKGVEARLTSGDYQVPARFFANSGLQRAIALSFYFALLERHLGGLGFVIMDDSILSLDDEHRETWSREILRPRMAKTQFIFATHQKEFVINCRHDFADGRVVEFNPRFRTRQISWRPGNRLDQAEQELEHAYRNAPKEMRNFRDEMLMTLNAYSPQPFFVPRNPRQTLEAYEGLTKPNPLAGNRQTEIVRKLRDRKVTLVLDPGTHVDTEARVTVTMVRQCLQVLRECDNIFRKELQRLDVLRSPARRVRQVPHAPIVLFPEIPAPANWNNPLELKMLGRAAAKPDAVTIDLSEPPISVKLKPGSTILVRSDTLDPIAKRGQWVILAAEDVSIADGNLAAVATGEGRHFLRRVWSDGDSWRMQSINPVQLSRVESVLKAEAAMRKVCGVLFEPRQVLGATADGSDLEWEALDYHTLDVISSLYTITVEGNSLEPIARAGQTVLVAKGTTVKESTMSKGSFAVVETKDEHVGNVIKRVFPSDDQYILLSPNPVEQHDPIPLSVDQIEKLWPLRGILFEAATAE